MDHRKSLGRTLRGGLAALAVTLAVTPALGAETYPSRTIRIIVNTGPGGLLDLTTRLVAEKLTAELGQAVIVENRAGGDGIVGILAVKGAAPDGYTLLATSGTIAIQTAVKLKPGYDIAADFAPLGTIMHAPVVLVEAGNGPDASFADFMARAKADPSKVSYASAGVGSGTHIPAAILFKEADLDILHIPYKGNGPAMPDVMSGRVDVIFEAYGSGGGKMRDGTLKPLAVTSRDRLAVLPDVPTIAESGFPDVDYYTYTGLLAPAGTPDDVVAKLSQALDGVLKDDTVAKQFAEGGGESLIMEPAAYKAYLLDNAGKMETLARELGIPKK